jgi:beta-lactamase regulating signal transducer with metallopeptidase domain
MTVLIAIALKSLLVAGATLLVLRLMKGRSAAERSTVAHVGLLALVVMAVAPIALPALEVETPALLGQAPAADAVAPAPAMVSSESRSVALPAAPVSAAPAPDEPAISTAAAAAALYAVPAAILLIITLLALGRLLALRARADVLVDGTWLSALARAQRRMGFKHGTALLTSDELSSPISWGLMRPVILLNSRAVEAPGEAEAIIAHELAHVARLDWVKLLLARVTTALFWFNPLVWMLAKEAHQLREEAADDSVLAADVADTDYAQLLVGIARHECRGLLIGAHGVAPGKGSLARRVARVLDPASRRGPVARSFALGMFAGAMLVAAPLAALTLTPAGSKAADDAPATRLAASAVETPADLPSIIQQGVSTSIAAASGAIQARDDVQPALDAHLAAAEMAREEARRARDAAREARRQARGPRSVIDSAIEMKAVGVTPQYLAAIRAASPRLRNLDPGDAVAMRAVGVTPEYIRELASAGLRNLDSDDLVQARALGLSAAYVRAMAAAGFRGDIDDYAEMKAVGVTPEFAAKYRKRGYRVLGPDQLIEMKTHGITAEVLDSIGRVRVTVQPRQPARPPRPPETPAEPDEDPGG